MSSKTLAQIQNCLQCRILCSYMKHNDDEQHFWEIRTDEGRQHCIFIKHNEEEQILGIPTIHLILNDNNYAVFHQKQALENHDPCLNAPSDTSPKSKIPLYFSKISTSSKEIQNQTSSSFTSETIPTDSSNSEVILEVFTEMTESCTVGITGTGFRIHPAYVQAWKDHLILAASNGTMDTHVQGYMRVSFLIRRNFVEEDQVLTYINTIDVPTGYRKRSKTKSSANKALELP